MEGRRRVVLGLNTAAYRAGLRIGTPITKAQALVDELIVKQIEREADADALEKLAHWAYRHISPMAAADHPDGLIIETTGADHLYGGEAAMAERIVARLGVLGIAARVAISDTWGAAHALARYNRRPIIIVPPGEAAAAIRPLPPAALRVAPDAVAGLHQLGFDRIGEIEGQPRAPMTLRFGPELWRRLDQAHGRANELIDAVRPPGLIEVSRNFAEPIGAAETIARYIQALTEEVCARLHDQGLGALRLNLVFHRVDSRAGMICLGMAKPVRDVKQIARMLKDKIERIDPGFGIEKMLLSAPLVQTIAPAQAASLIDEPTPDTGALFDILANRFGHDRFHKVMPVESDVPERSVKRVAASLDIAARGWQTLWRRPLQILATPEAIQTVALLPDHPPVSFIWRGTRYRVRCADGPERIRGEWWKADAEVGAIRDYFHVEDDGGENFWIYRSGDGERAESGSHAWFMHGLFA